MTSEHFDLEELFLELTDPRRSNPMNSLIRAELLKLRTTRTFWWTRRRSARLRPRQHRPRHERRPSGVAEPRQHQGFRNVFAAASSGGVIDAWSIGILLMAGEFRFNTITSTFLITPDRRRSRRRQDRSRQASSASPSASSRRCSPSPSPCPGWRAGTSTSPPTAPTSLVVLARRHRRDRDRGRWSASASAHW